MSIENLLKQIKNAKVYKRPANRKIKDLLSDFNDGNIVIPEYQRSFVWDVSIQSRFIESIFMEIPIPAIFLLEKYNEETGEETYEVIDGVQRLSTLDSFARDKLKLSTNLKLSDLERTSFSRLPTPITNLFLNKEISIITIEKNTDPEIQFEIFERLNRGSVSLTHQELRNCMYHGEFNSFLVNLSKMEDYRELLSIFPIFKTVEPGKPDKSRMLDIEMVLRFFALFETFAETGRFVSPRKEQLNFYMKVKKEKEKGLEDNIYDGGYLKANEELQDVFKKVCKMVKLTFKDNHYKRFTVNKAQAKFVSFNKAVFDVQMLGFSDYSVEEISDKTDIIYNEFIELCCFNTEFVDSIDKSTDDKINVRVEIWKKLLSNIVINTDYYRSKLDKKAMAFNYNPECSCCNKKIKDIDESYFDLDSNTIQHIVCYVEKNNLKISSKRISISDLNLPDETEFRAKYKGDMYKGIIMDGILVLSDGGEFSSPSAAAKHICEGASVNGWVFWEFKLPEENDWMLIDTLR